MNILNLSFLNKYQNNFLKKTFTEGMHTLKVVIDSNNQISETDELNNAKSVTFDVY